MKNRKSVKIISLAMAAIMSMGLATGCSKTANDKDEQGRTIVSVGSWPQKEGKNLDSWNARKDKFEADNADVAIIPDPWAFELRTFYSKAAGGQLPVLYNTHFTEVAQVIEAGYSADLTDALKKRGYDGKFNQQILDVVSKDGKVYAYPFSAYILGLGYNTDMFKAAGLMDADGTPKQPKDWYELADFAVKIKETTGKPGFVFPTANNYGGWMFTSLAWSFGADFMEQDENGAWKATFNSAQAQEALQFIKDLRWKYDVLPSNTLIDGTEYYKTFAVGGAGMLMTAGDIPRKLTQYGMVPAQVGMMGMPAGPKRHVTLLGGDVYCVSPDATDAQIEASLRWIETQYSYDVTDDYKINQQSTIDKAIADNQLINIKNMSVWSGNTTSRSYLHELIDANSNANPNHVKLYNEFVENCPAEIQPEEPVCAQELYGVLDNCIQEVLLNKDADCAALLEKANSDFQANYLDNLSF